MATITGTAACERIEQLFAELASSALTLGDRRMEERLSVQAPVSLGVVAGGTYRPLYRTWATELSHGGLGLLCENHIPVGLEMFANLEALAHQPVVVPVRVIYGSQVLPHTYRVGVAICADDNGLAG